MTAKPVRIQRKRVKGYRIQEVSLALNGLPAVYVGSPTVFSNAVGCTPHGCTKKPCECCEAYRCCVDVYREYVLSGVEDRPSTTGAFRYALDAVEGYPIRGEIIRRLPELKGKNLVSWCAPDRPSYVDVLLELANR